MLLLLSRHGNTFDPGDRIYWVGSGENPPLVEKGREQADSLGRALAEAGRPAAIYSGPLRRCVEYGEIVNKHFSEPLPIVVDSRLNELDYGGWSGLTDGEVAERFGQDSLDGWNKRCQWPSRGDWAGSPEAVFQEVQSFVAELKSKFEGDQNALVLAITSNGVLRYFLKLAEREFASRVANGTFKVATGRICLLDLAGDAGVQLWDAAPAELLAVSRRI
ncbi:MAG: histidine phosphatase family protein [Cyanobacteria bacterium HKST-UBA02]|nr:histidine phosphatase family protein [Cyanobacteria bacterium HKST-UBA02]